VFRPLNPLITPTSTEPRVTFSGDGSQLFLTRPSESSGQILAYLTQPGPDLFLMRELTIQPAMKIQPSHTGKWIICFEQDTRKETNRIAIIACSSTRVLEIRSDMAHFGYQSFHFSTNDDQLVTFLVGRRNHASVFSEVTITVWQLTSKGPQKRSEASAQMMVRNRPPHFAVKGDESAVIVTCNRSIYTVKFKPCVVFADLDFVNGYGEDGKSWHIGEFFVPQPRIKQNLTKMLVKMSWDGRRFARLYVSESEVRLQIFRLDGKTTTVGGVLLDKAYRIPKEDYSLLDVYVGLNSSFNTLVTGGYVFLIDPEAEYTPSVKLDVDFELIESSYHTRDEGGMTISSCGGVVTFQSPLRAWDDSLS
jgi:hypothetical protein